VVPPRSFFFASKAVPSLGPYPPDCHFHDHAPAGSVRMARGTDENRLNNVGTGDLGVQCLPFSKSERNLPYIGTGLAM